jgi:RNA polymerase sigma-70 factor (ECF subfamily)
LERFETLIERHHDEIFRYLWRMLRREQDAEDAAQEVFMRAYRAYDRLRPDSNARAWLYKIATNTALTMLKRQGRDARNAPQVGDEMLGALPGNDPPPQEHVMRAEAEAAVRAEIDALPTKQQAAVVMRYLHGLDYADIAGALDCSQDSARANVYQALKKLRASLVGEELA